MFQVVFSAAPETARSDGLESGPESNVRVIGPDHAAMAEGCRKRRRKPGKPGSQEVKKPESQEAAKPEENPKLEPIKESIYGSTATISADAPAAAKPC